MRGQRLVGILVVVMALLGGLTAQASDATPEPAASPAWGEVTGPIGMGEVKPDQPESLWVVAHRAFARPDNGTLDAADTFIFLVMRFDSATSTQAAWATMVDAVKSDGLVPASVSALPRAESAWFTDRFVEDGIAFERATVLFVEDSCVQWWSAFDRDANPLTRLEDVVVRVMGTNLERTTQVPAGTPLVDRLPGTADVPAGFVLTYEWTIGVGDCGTPTAATPESQ